jgi:hypothetical protein
MGEKEDELQGIVFAFFLSQQKRSHRSVSSNLIFRQPLAVFKENEQK